MSENYKGNLFIVAAPSGGGKTSLVKKLVSEFNDIEISISHTTRTIRPGEVDKVDYYFIDKDQFMTMIKEGAFVEHAKVFNNYYGTSFKQIEDRLRGGIDVVLDIDWQGAKQMRARFKDATSIFIIPPSIEVLKKRLMNRQQDGDDVIETRMKCAHDELSHYAEFDYLIVNDSFENAANELKAIVAAKRLTMDRQSDKQGKLLSFLLSTE